MQKETERHVIAEFIKKTGYENKEIYASFVKVAQLDKWKFEISTGMIYIWNGEQSVQTEQRITCKFLPTAMWIYQHCKDICDASNSGDIVTDIPFDSV
ncbi:MAG: hypothetical protein PHS80_00265 [Methanothrix sp.]|nr:hypothetical protein [Bacteroidales bacterium]MDD2753934.1 hypothetical protein [Methanothrix sp.]